MVDNVEIARNAVASAYRVRLNAGYDLKAPLCVYDLPENLEIELRFVEIPSLEGVFYDAEPPVILVSALRPAGRRRYTCAHEIGHWFLGHSTTVDELIQKRGNSTKWSPEEFAAQVFAGALLMPKPAITHAFAVRGWNPARPEPMQVLTIASLFGVGYGTLINHLRNGIRILGEGTAQSLLKKSLF